MTRYDLFYHRMLSQSGAPRRTPKKAASSYNTDSVKTASAEADQP
jgi:hypothetical protein